MQSLKVFVDRIVSAKTAGNQTASRRIWLTLSIAFISLSVNGTAFAQQVTVDQSLLQSLQKIVGEQQKLLKRQANQLDTQSQTITTLKTRVDQLDVKATEAQSTAAKAIDTAKSAGAGGKTAKLVSSGSERVKLSVSGHINQAFNAVNDGDTTKSYFVDNDVSNSRIRFVGTGQVTQDTMLGVVSEIAFSPNNSFNVSQNNETANDFIDVRKTEAFVRNDGYGQLLLGKGQAAADDTAEYDLSLVAGPIMYSGVADIVGGIQFTNGNNLTGVTVANAFSNFDGNRQNRLRYDSPVVGPGLQLSVSAGSADRYDAAITWGGDYGDWTGVIIGPFTTLGAVSIRETGDSNVDWRLAGSWSMLHDASGLSLTVSGGTDEAKNGDNPYNLYGKLAWDTKYFSFGATGFGADFTYSKNVSGNGDEGMSYGLAAVQLVDDFGVEIYTQFRVFDLDRNGAPQVDKIYVGSTGVRVKF